uniref:Uncharacterized protein n=1 Tax=Peronospora matthiolae TaxID=2874970 RepID=A0AAV1UDN0_9STRA
MENPATASTLALDEIPRGARGSKRVALTTRSGGSPAGPSSSNDSGPSDSPMAAPTDTAQAHHTDGSPDEIMDEPISGSILPVDPPKYDDVPMDKPFPAAEPGSSPPRVDSRPTMADVLGQQEHLRRDHAEADAARRRVETHKPLASDIEWFERQYASGGDWSFIASRIDQARPYALPRANYDMVIATGRTLAKTPLQRIMVSLSGTHHRNDSLEDLYRSHEIGQISKLPEGDLRIKVKSKEVCLRLERTKVNILGGVYTFKEFDVPWWQVLHRHLQHGLGH